MEEERREVYQEQQETEAPAEAAPEPQKRGGLSGAWWFFFGLIVGVIVMLAITIPAWKIPLDSANEEVKTLEAQVQAANKQADRMRDALARAQKALNDLNEAMQKILPQGTTTQQAPTGGGEQTPPAQ
jgi:cell division protein FtsL